LKKWKLPPQRGFPAIETLLVFETPGGEDLYISLKKQVTHNILFLREGMFFLLALNMSFLDFLVEKNKIFLIFGRNVQKKQEKLATQLFFL